MRPNYFPLALKLLIAIATLLFGDNVYAANWYVRPSSAGSSTGADWNNAWSFSNISWGSVKPGDTVWLAGGTYTTHLTVDTICNGTATSPVFIKRVTAANPAPVAAAGWNPAFDSQVLIQYPSQDPALHIPASNYITVDGNQNAGSLRNNTRVYGIKIVIPSTGGDAIRAGDGWPPFSGNPGNTTGVTLINIDTLGPGSTTNATTSNGWNFQPYDGPRTNYLIHDCRSVGFTEALRESNFNNFIMEYCWVSDTITCPGDHEDIILHSSGGSETIRYNMLFRHFPDGIIFDPGGYGAFNFYGNVVYYTTSWVLLFNGTAGSSVFGPIRIYNNTFFNPPLNPDWGTGFPPGALSITGNSSAGSEIKNNIFYYTATGAMLNPGSMVIDYNAYNYTNLASGDGIVSTDTHHVNISSDPFVNSGGTSTARGAFGVDFDFHLTATSAPLLQNGTALAAPYNVDGDGNVRGANGHWYMGAYQYSGSSPQAPPAPTNLHSVP